MSSGVEHSAFREFARGELCADYCIPEWPARRGMVIERDVLRPLCLSVARWLRDPAARPVGVVVEREAFSGWRTLAHQIADWFARKIRFSDVRVVVDFPATTPLPAAANVLLIADVPCKVARAAAIAHAQRHDAGVRVLTVHRRTLFFRETKPPPADCDVLASIHAGLSADEQARWAEVLARFRLEHRGRMPSVWATAFSMRWTWAERGARTDVSSGDVVAWLAALCPPRPRGAPLPDFVVRAAFWRFAVQRPAPAFEWMPITPGEAVDARAYSFYVDVLAAHSARLWNDALATAVLIRAGLLRFRGADGVLALADARLFVFLRQMFDAVPTEQHWALLNSILPLRWSPLYHLLKHAALAADGSYAAAVGEAVEGVVAALGAGDGIMRCHVELLRAKLMNAGGGLRRRRPSVVYYPDPDGIPPVPAKYSNWYVHSHLVSRLQALRNAPACDVAALEALCAEVHADVAAETTLFGRAEKKVGWYERFRRFRRALEAQTPRPDAALAAVARFLAEINSPPSAREDLHG